MFVVHAASSTEVIGSAEWVCEVFRTASSLP